MADTDLILRPDLLRARTRLLYDQLLFSILSNLLVMCGLATLIWSSAQRSWLLVWLGAALVFAPIRWLLLWSAWRQRDTAFDLNRWLHLYTATAVTAGTLLSSASFLLPAEHLAALFELAVVICIMSMGSILVHAAYPPAHTGYLVAVLLPVALRCLWTGEMTYVTLGAGILLFLPVNLYLARKSQSGLIESIELRLRNQALITELTRQKELAQSAQAEAERVNAARVRFFAAASHDLRQPVQALALFGAALENELHGQRSHSTVRHMRAAVRELGDLLSAMLDYSRIDAAVVESAPCHFAVADLLRRMADEFVPLAGAQGLECHVVPSRAWAYSDPLLIERIVRNFMDNALKYTPKGKILLGCRRGAQSLRIEVHDTGIGIAPEHQKAVFDEFFQINNPERDRQKGLGLGLAIAAGLSRLLEHPLTLRSHPRRGCVFAITVPLGEEASASVPAALEATADVMRGAVILLIDDDQAIRRAASELLQGWGSVVLAAESVEEALALLEASASQPGAILADFRLRDGKDGVQAILAVRAYCGRPIPAALLTGDTAPGRMVEAADSGFPLVYKPLSAGKLRVLTSKLLRS